MNYFSQLLDSYGRLKRRTFKLQYILEAETKKPEAAAKEKRQAAVKAVAEDVKGAFDAAMNGQDQVGVGNAQNLNFEGGDPDQSGNPQVKVSGSNVGEKLYTQALWTNAWTGTWQHSGSAMMKLCSAWLADAEDGGSDDAAEAAQLAAEQEEIDRRRRLDTPGGLFETDPDRYDPVMLQKLIDEEKIALKLLDDLCAQKRISSKICGNEEDGGLWRKQYIVGSNAKSLESKLFGGIGGVSYNASGFLEKRSLGPGAGLEALQTINLLLGILSKGSSAFAMGACDVVNNRVANMSQNDIVLYDTGSKSEGVVIENGSFTKEIINSLGCDLETHKFEGSTNDQNNTKGRWNEKFMGMIIRAFSVARRYGPDGANDLPRLKKEIRKIADEFDAIMVAARQELEEFAGATPLSEQAVALEAYPVMQMIHEQIGILTTPGELQNFARQLTIQVGGLLKGLQADDAIAGGEAQTLGGKVDNFFMYIGPDAVQRASDGAILLDLDAKDVVQKTPAQLYNNASEALKSQIEITLSRHGLKVDDNTTQLSLLSIGNKLIEGDWVKLGDLRLMRAIEIAIGNAITGQSAPPNSGAYHTKLDASLQLDPKELRAMDSYGRGIKTQLESTKVLDTPKNYQAGGIVDTTDPATVAKSVGIQVMSQFPYGGKGTNIWGAYHELVPAPTQADPKNKEWVPREFLGDSDPAIKARKYISEALKRDYLAYRLGTDLRAGGAAQKKATNVLCKIAGATIMEMSEMSQFVTEEKTGGAPIVFNQNDVLRAIGEARVGKDAEGNPLLKIEQTDLRGLPEGSGGGNTFKLKFPMKDKEGNTHIISYKINMERQHHAPAFAGKISKEDVQAVGREVQPLQRAYGGTSDQRGTSPTDIEAQETLQAHTLHKYIEGQMKLLEELMKQTI